MLQTSWTAIFGSVAILEALVLGWWAEKLYKIWSRSYSFVRARLPWQTEAEVEAEASPPKNARRPRQAAVEARDACYKSMNALTVG